MIEEASQFVLVIVWALILAYFLGGYLTRLITGRPRMFETFLSRIERPVFRIMGIDPTRSMTWKEYLFALLSMNALVGLFSFVVLLAQGVLPLNPTGVPGTSPDLAFHTATSFATNTDLQHYAGEASLSLFSQLSLMVPMFIAPGTAIAAGIAFIRALPTSTGKIGNFYADLTRVVLTILLPVSIVVAILLNSQGVPQTLNGLLTTGSFEGASQTIPIGPVASWESIKMFGQNGGGFFGANSAHPFENPNGFTNFLEVSFLLAVPLAFPIAYGKVLGRGRLPAAGAPRRAHVPRPSRAHPQPARDRPRVRTGPGDPRHSAHPVRLHAGPVRVHLLRREQRVRLPWDPREHAVLEHRDRARDGPRPLRADRAHARDRGRVLHPGGPRDAGADPDRRPPLHGDAVRPDLPALGPRVPAVPRHRPVRPVGAGDESPQDPRQERTAAGLSAGPPRLARQTQPPVPREGQSRHGRSRGRVRPRARDGPRTGGLRGTREPGALVLLRHRGDPAPDRLVLHALRGGVGGARARAGRCLAHPREGRAGPEDRRPLGGHRPVAAPRSRGRRARERGRVHPAGRGDQGREGLHR